MTPQSVLRVTDSLDAAQIAIRNACRSVACPAVMVTDTARRRLSAP